MGLLAQVESVAELRAAKEEAEAVMATTQAIGFLAAWRGQAHPAPEMGFAAGFAVGLAASASEGGQEPPQ